MKTKEKIVEAAIDCIFEKDFEQTTVSDIVKRAGVAQGTFYIYFNHKKEVLKEIMIKIRDEVEKNIENNISDKDDPVEKINKAFKAAYSVYLKYKDLTVSLQNEAVILEMEHYSQQIGRDNVAQLAKWIEEGKNQGLFSVDEAHLTAYFVISLYEKIVYSSLREKKIGSFEEIYEKLVQFIYRGLGYIKEE